MIEFGDGGNDSLHVRVQNSNMACSMFASSKNKNALHVDVLVILFFLLKEK